MKQLFLLLPLTLVLFNACIKKFDYENTPVILPTDAQHKSYYLKTTVLKQQLVQKKIAFIKFEFSGSSLATTVHNRNQANALAWATSQPETKHKFYNLKMYGEKANDIKKSTLIKFLSQNKVNLERIQVLPVQKSHEQAVVENVLQDRLDKVDLVSVAIQEL